MSQRALRDATRKNPLLGFVLVMRGSWVEIARHVLMGLRRFSGTSVQGVVATLLVCAGCSKSSALSSTEVEAVLACDTVLFEATRACTRDNLATTCPGRDAGLSMARCPDSDCFETSREEYRSCAGGMGPEVADAVRCVELCTVNLENCLIELGTRFYDCRAACPVGSRICETNCRASVSEVAESCLGARRVCPETCLDAFTEER